MDVHGGTSGVLGVVPVVVIGGKLGELWRPECAVRGREGSDGLLLITRRVSLGARSRSNSTCSLTFPPTYGDSVY